MNITNHKGDNPMPEIKGRMHEIPINQKKDQSKSNPISEMESFPIEVFPKRLQEFIRDAIEALGVDLDFLSAGVLYAASVAAGNTYKIQLKRGSDQSGVIWLALIGSPNCNKSGALSFPLEPILKHDKESYEKYLAELAEFEAIAQLSKKEREEAGYTEMPDPPLFKRSIIQDATPEALYRAHEQNPKGLGVWRDELRGWIQDFNRYRQGSDQENWLSSWSLKPFSIDRVSTTPKRISSPYLSVAGTIQPGVIESLISNGRGSNGFLDRILFVYKPDLEKSIWTTSEIPEKLTDQYDKAIQKLLNLELLEGNPQFIKPSNRAIERILSYFNEVNKPKCDTAKNELLKGILGKFDIHMTRLTLILHLIDFAFGSGEKPKQTISLQTVENAIKVIEFFQAHAMKVYWKIFEESPVEKLSKDRQKIYEKLPPHFTTQRGVEIAKESGMSERTFKAFLSKNVGVIFDKLKQGNYEKLY